MGKAERKEAKIEREETKMSTAKAKAQKDAEVGCNPSFMTQSMWVKPTWPADRASLPAKPTVQARNVAPEASASIRRTKKA
jgi:hypothetical protein